MFYTGATIEYRDSTLAALVPAAVGIDGRVIGMPIALAVRGVLELIGWVLGVTIR